MAPTIPTTNGPDQDTLPAPPQQRAAPLPDRVARIAAAAAPQKDTDREQRIARFAAFAGQSPRVPAALNRVAGMNPEDVARAARMASRDGISPTAAWIRASNGTEASQEANRYGYQNALARSPYLREWLSNDVNAGVGRDDLETLLRLESNVELMRPERSVFGELASASAEGFIGLASSYYHLSALYGKMSFEEAAQGVAGVESLLQRMRESRSPELQRYFQRIDQASGFGILPVAFSDIPDLAIMVAQNIGFAAPSILGAIVGTAVAPGPGTVAGAFGGGYFTESGAWITEGLSRRGVNLTDPDQVLAAYHDAPFMANLMNEASLKAVGTAGIDALSMLLGGRAFSQARGFFRKTIAVGREVLEQSGLEIAGEGTGQFLATGRVDRDEAVLEGVAALGQSMFEIMLGVFIRAPGGIRLGLDRLSKSTQAVQDAAGVRKVADGWRESKAAKRLPERVKPLLDAMGAEAGVSFRFDRDAWDAYWNNLGESPADAAAKAKPVGGRDEYAESATTGALTLTLGDYVGAYADTEHLEPLLMEARLRDGGETLSEAQDWFAETEAAVKTAAEDLVQLNQETESLSAEVAALTEEVAGLEAGQAADVETGSNVPRETIADALPEVQTRVADIIEQAAASIRAGEVNEEALLGALGGVLGSAAEIGGRDLRPLLAAARADPEGVASGIRGQVRMAEAQARLTEAQARLTEAQSRLTEAKARLAEIEASRVAEQTAGDALEQRALTELGATRRFTKTQAAAASKIVRQAYDVLSDRYPGLTLDALLEVFKARFLGALPGRADVAAPSVDPSLPYSEQPEAVRRGMIGIAADPVWSKKGAASLQAMLQSDPTGQDFLDAVRAALGDEQAVADLLAKHGAGQTVLEQTTEWDERGAEREDLPDTIDIDGTQRPTSNSTGAQIALTEQGVRNFWAWFGSSRVVDEQGRPLVVYHGTDRQGVKYMRTSFEAGLGIFMSDNEDVSATFTLPREYGEPVFEDADGNEIEAGDLLSLYSRIENPLVVEGDAAQRFVDDTAEQVRVLEAAQASGHDGVIVRDVLEGIGERYQSDNYVAFAPTQIKSINNRGTYDRSDPRILYQDASRDAPTFYSKALRVVESLGGQKLRGNQWVKTLKNKGVKPAELFWSGLDEWLAAQTEAVPQADVVAFLETHGVEVEEVVLGGDSRAGEVDAILADAADRGIMPEGMTTASVGDLRAWGADDLADRMSAHFDAVANETDATKFSDYQLPGGENYRELLLTLPGERTQLVYPDPLPLDQMPDGWHFIRDSNASPGRRWSVSPEGVPHGPPSYTYRATKEEALEVLVRRLNEERNQAAADAYRAENAGNTFTSGHYDTPNVLAHVRFNERTDADGGKVLFIEEIQSDWAQKGRKEGFTGRELTDAERDERHSIYSLPDGVRTPEQQARMEDLDAIATQSASSIPAAPFVGATSDWVTLSLKRMIRWAAENGFDSVAWTTGEQQAARYDLSKHVDSIRYDKNSDGTYRIAAMKNGDAVLKESAATPQRLEELVGKEVAKKIIEGEGLSRPENGNVAAHSELSGVDLQVGGEGIKTFYDKIVPAAASKIGKRFGAKVGETTLDAGGADTGTGGDFVDDFSAHSLPITDKMRTEALAEGFALFQDNRSSSQPRGATLFGPPDANGNRTFDLAFLEKAAPDTFVHEFLGHMWLEVLGAIAQRTDAPTQIAADYQTWLDFMGIKDHAEHQARITEIGVIGGQISALERDIEARKKARQKYGPQSKKLKALRKQRADLAAPFEKGAEAAEAYVLRGEAPSVEMRAVLRAFRRFMLKVYEAMRRVLGVNALSPEMVAVFDRILATDEDIAAAAYEAGGETVDEALLAALPEDMAADLRSRATSAADEAREQAAAEAAADADRIEEAMRSDRLDEIRAEVADRINADPAVQIVAALRDGIEADGQPLPDGMEPEKIAAGSVTGETADALREIGILTDTDGLPFADVVNELGLGSEDEAVRALRRAANKDRWIEVVARAQLRAEVSGALDTKRGRSRAATRHVANAARISKLEGEMLAAKALLDAENAGRRGVRTAIPKLRDLRALAAEQLSRLTDRQITPSTYLAAAKRESGKFTKAMIAKDYPVAIRAKARELYNAEKHRIALSVRDAHARHANRLRFMDKPNTVSRLTKAGFTYADQMSALLDRFNLAKISNKAAERLMKLRAFVDERNADQAEKGDDRLLEIPERLLDDAFRKHYRDLTLAEIADVRETADRIYHFATNKNKLIKLMRDRELGSLLDELIPAIESSQPRLARADSSASLTTFELMLRNLESWHLWHEKVPAVLRNMDSQQDGGIAVRTFARPINDAQTAEEGRLGVAAAALDEVLAMLPDYGTRSFRDDKMWRPGFPEPLAHQDRLGVGMHYGNPQGRERLLNGHGWTDAHARAVLATFDETDVAFLNALSAWYERFWPEIAAQKERIEGVAPERVEALPYETPGGTVNGGYHPLEYQGIFAHELSVKEQADIMKRGVFTSSQTRHGHDKARKDHVGRKVRLDLGVAVEHMGEVIHDLTHREALIDINRVLRHKRTQEAIVNHYGEGTYSLLQNMLESVAVGERGQQSRGDRLATKARINVSSGILGFKLMTGAVNITGLYQSWRRISGKALAEGIRSWFASDKTMRETVEWVYEKDPFMSQRAINMHQTVHDISRRLGGKKQPAWREWAWLVIVKTQVAVDIPTWLGAYKQALGEGVSDAEAVARASQAVRDSQGSAQVIDLAEVQRGNEWRKLFTVFMFYLNTTYSQTWQSITAFKRSGRSVEDAARLAGDMMLLYWMPAMTISLLGMVLRGSEGEDDRNIYEKLMALLTNTMQEAGGMALGGMVGVREFSGLVQGFTDYESTAGARVIPVAYRAAEQIGQMEWDPALRKSLIDLAGMTFGIPSGQINATWNGLEADVSGVRRLTAPLVGAPYRNR